MNLLLTWCNHETASLDVRERLAFPDETALACAYSRWRERFEDYEVVILSTCNRVEVYAAAENPERELTSAQIAGFLSDVHDVPSDDFITGLRSLESQQVVTHLFEVVSSLDSMVLGEPQIVNQVKSAYRIAREHDACGPLTNLLFQRAVSVSARVRSETRLSEGRVSIASVAVGEFGKRIFNRFEDKTVLLIGAGEMAEETLRYLDSEGVGQVIIANRDPARATRLSERLQGQVVPFDQLDSAMMQADVIVSTTGSAESIVDRQRFERVRAAGDRHTILILDLGAPRDFAADVSRVDENIFLYDIDDLKTACDANRKARAGEMLAAREIIAEAADRIGHDFHHRTTGPIIQRLKREWHEIGQQELEVLFRRLPRLSGEERNLIERSLGRIVNKLLHPPLETLKDEAKEGPPDGLLNAMKRLFQLKD